MWPQWTEKKLEKPRTRRRKRGQKKTTSQLRLVARHMKTALRCHSVDMMAKLITLYSPIENVRRMKHYTISVFGHSLTEYKREMNTMAWDETNRRGNRDDWWWNNRRRTRSANEERKQNCKLNFIKFFFVGWQQAPIHRRRITRRSSPQNRSFHFTLILGQKFQ